MEVQVITLTKDDLEVLLRRTAKLAVSELKDELARTPQIMTKAQAAGYLGKSIATINRYMREGMPFRKVDTGYPEFYKNDIDRWLADRSHTENVSI